MEDVLRHFCNTLVVCLIPDYLSALPLGWPPCHASRPDPFCTGTVDFLSEYYVSFRF